RVDVVQVENIKLPKLDAFWSEDLESPQKLDGEAHMVNGVPYRVALLRRRALFPLKAGKQLVDPVEVDVISGLVLYGNGRKWHRVSQPSEINVLPLPAGAQPGFENTNVGTWKVSLGANPPASPVKTNLNQPVNVDLVIEGQGNFKNLTLPK